MSFLKSYRRAFFTLIVAIAILVPAVIFATLGIRAFRAESLLLRQNVERDKIQSIRVLGNQLSRRAIKAINDLEQQIEKQGLDLQAELVFLARHPLVKHSFVIKGQTLVYPAVSEKNNVPKTATLLWTQAWPERYWSLNADVNKIDLATYIRLIKHKKHTGKMLSIALASELQHHFRRALSIYSKLTKESPDIAARALLGSARVYRNQKNLKQAKATYRLLGKLFKTKRSRLGADYELLAEIGLLELKFDLDKAKGLFRRLMQHRYSMLRQTRYFYLRLVARMIAKYSSIATDSIRLEKEINALIASEFFGYRLAEEDLDKLNRLAQEKVQAIALDQETIIILKKSGNRVFGYEFNPQKLADEIQKGHAHRAYTLSLIQAGEEISKDKVSAGQFFREPLKRPLGYWSLIAHHKKGYNDNKSRYREIAMLVALLVLMLSGLFFTYRGVRRELDLAHLKSQFLLTVTHELKTPLTSIRMFAEMLEDGIAATEKDQKRYHGVIIRESERLGHLITNILDFAKIEKGTRQYEILPLNMGAFCKDAVDAYQRLANAKEVRIEVVFESFDVDVWADREAATTALLNVINNAAKYSYEHPVIELERLEKDGYYGVLVRDHGIGISSTEKSKIFNDFYRSPDAVRHGIEGTGLGLALVRRHMEAFGGRIDVQSNLGNGSSFYLWFRAALKDKKKDEKND